MSISLSLFLPTHHESLIKMAKLDETGLKRLALVYKNEALEYSKSCSFYRNIMIISGLIGAISGFNYLKSDEPDESKPIWAMAGKGALLFFLFAACCYIDSFNRGSNANL